MDIGTAKPDRRPREQDRAPSDRHPRSGDELFGRRVRARCGRGHAQAFGRGDGSRCWSAARCCISMPSTAGHRGTAARRMRAFARPDRGAGRREGLGGSACGARARWIRRRRPAFTATIRSASSARSRCIAPPARRSPAAAQRRRRCSSGVEVHGIRRGAARTASTCTTRIAARFEAMLAAGFLDEVRTLYERTDLTAEHPSMRAVGYRQAWTYLAGRCGLDEAKEKAVAATRQLAKRQLTWLRRRQSATWLDSMHPHVASMIMRCTVQGRVCRDGQPFSWTASPLC